MKKLTTIIAVSLMLISCQRKEDINCIYNGAVILEVNYLGLVMTKQYVIKHNGVIKKVYPYRINQYKEGEIINKKCL